MQIHTKVLLCVNADGMPLSSTGTIIIQFVALKGESISSPNPLQSDIKQVIPPAIFVCTDAKRLENGYYKERETFGSDFNDLCTVS